MKSVYLCHCKGSLSQSEPRLGLGFIIAVVTVSLS